MSKHDFKGTLVVITGAGSGIGRATAQAFALRGADVALCDVDAERVKSIAAELGERAVVAEAVDVSNRDAMAAFAAKVHERARAVDVVVNNAGVAVGGSFLDHSLDDWSWVLGVNVMGVVHGCHYFIPNMVARGQGGSVINVASIFGIYPAPSTSAYVASKFAVRGFSQSLRVELAPHRIGVTAICPGLINTSIIADGRMRGSTDAKRAKLLEHFTRGAKPAIVARAIIDAVHTNPEIRTVGFDAWAIHQVTKVAPGITTKLGSLLARRVG